MLNLHKNILFIGVLALVFHLVFPQYSVAYALSGSEYSMLNVANSADLILFSGSKEADFNQLISADWRQPMKKMKIPITAYSSTVDQTDPTPFITANGRQVADGIIAANFLPFGAKIKIPSLYGDKVFSVEDRMNKRYKYHLDIWMPDLNQAKQFGVKYVEVEVF